MTDEELIKYLGIEPKALKAIGLLTPAITRLIIAARVVAYERQDVEAINELDHAVEAFSESVPWDDEPDALTTTRRSGY